MVNGPIVKPDGYAPLFGVGRNPHPTDKLTGRRKANRHERRAMNQKVVKQHYEPPAADPIETKFRHQHWEAKRKLVRSALVACGYGTTALQCFDNCGAECYVFHNAAEGKYKLVGCYCKNRHCEPCMKARANLLAANLQDRLEDHDQYQYRFITLTLKHTDTPLREQIDKLYASFKKLRASKLWKRSQKGGCAILEVKWSPDTGEWHPHLHLICEGEHIRSDLLSAEWYAATGNSYVVDVKLLKTDRDAAHYLSKYVSKGTNDAVWCNEGAAQEWVCAMRGTRTAATFGTWRGFALMKKPGESPGWKRIGSLCGITRAANEGQAWAIHMLNSILADLQYNPHRPHKPRDPKTTSSRPPA